MADTEHYVRDDVRGFLDMLEQMGGKGVEEVGADEGRAQMRAMSAVAEAEPRAMAVQKDLTCPGPAGTVPIRFYDVKAERGPSPCVIFIHGGGFVIGDLDVYNALCTEISHHLDLPVVSVDYRLAPEHAFPAAPDDCEAVARWVASSPDELERDITGLIITGDSAGGNLTIVTTNQLMNEPADVPVVVQAPIYPVASDTSQHSSFAMFTEGFLLTGAAMAWFNDQYGGDAGMVITYDKASRAIEAIKSNNSKTLVVFLTPKGRLLDNKLTTELAKTKNLTIVCGRYEGFDQRLIENYADLELSVGDYVISGGEIAALTIIDSVSRMVNSVVGKKESVEKDSFQNSLLKNSVPFIP